MISSIIVSITALVAMVFARQVDTNEGAYWGACDSANIPYTAGPFTLSPDTTANVSTREHNLRSISTRERVIVRSGEKDDITVDFDIKVSDESLKNAISAVITSDNEVSLVLNGEDFDYSRPRECIVATTYIGVPKKVHHLIIDVWNSAVEFDSINDIAFDELTVRAKNGGVSIRDSVFSTETLDASLMNGAFHASESTIFVEKAVVQSRNGAVTGRFTGSPIQYFDASSNNGAVEVVLVDGDKDDEDVVSDISASSNHGHVGIKSNIKGPINVKASSSTGAVTVDIYENVGGTVHASTRVGHATISGVDITKNSKTITGQEIEGIFGDKDGKSTIDINVNVGGLVLFVGAKGDQSNTDPDTKAVSFGAPIPAKEEAAIRTAHHCGGQRPKENTDIGDQPSSQHSPLIRALISLGIALHVAVAMIAIWYTASYLTSRFLGGRSQQASSSITPSPEVDVKGWREDTKQ